MSISVLVILLRLASPRPFLGSVPALLADTSVSIMYVSILVLS